MRIAAMEQWTTGTHAGPIDGHPGCGIIVGCRENRSATAIGYYANVQRPLLFYDWLYSQGKVYDLTSFDHSRSAERLNRRRKGHDNDRELVREMERQSLPATYDSRTD